MYCTFTATHDPSVQESFTVEAKNHDLREGRWMVSFVKRTAVTIPCDDVSAGVKYEIHA